jgi:hypothetical protein
MAKPAFAGLGGPSGGKAVLPSSIIKPGKYQPKKFQMEMPDEKQSGLFGLRRDEEEVVESLALDESSARRISSKPIVQQKQLGPQILKTKIKDALADGGSQLLKNRPASQIKPQVQDEGDEDDYNNDFEDDAGGDDQLDKLRKAINRENQKAVKHQQEKPAHPPVSS